MDLEQLKSFISSMLEEVFAPRPIALAKRWAGGVLILKPDNDTQSKEIPLEVFFKKLLGIRESLRVLEQKLNNHETLSSEDRATFQSYLTKCYGSLTTFNILFKEDKDKFVGAGTTASGVDDSKAEKLTMGQARKKLGLNEYGDS